jgi:phage terminase large subunit GpA-like protein
MNFPNIESMIAAAAAGVRPPERLTVAEAAEKYRWLNNPGSYVGWWDNEFAPYLVEPMEVLTGPEHTGMIFGGPARTGKSDMFFNWLLHTAKFDPSDMMMVLMTMNVARDWSQKDLRRVFRHSKEVGALLAPGRSNQSTHDIRFMSGMHLLVKWPTITELSGKTVRYNWLADYDRMPESVDGEGNAFDLTAKRAETYRRNGMTVAESSPGFEITDPKWQARTPHEAPPTRGVLSLYNRGDRRRWYWPCPHCKTAFEPHFKLLQIPDSRDHVESAEATVMACPHCGGIITHDSDPATGLPGKHELNVAGKWVKDGQIWIPSENRIEGSPYRSDIASFWMMGPAASFTNWRGIVLKYLKAEEEFERTGSEEALKSTVNTDQGLPYLPRALDTGRLPEDLKAMSREWAEKTVPEGVRFLTATVDVQATRFEVQVHGQRADGGKAVIDRFALRKSRRRDEEGDPLPLRPASYLEDWDLMIDEVLLKTYPLGDGSGRHMAIKIVGCDSGGAADKKNDSTTTMNAYDFWRKLKACDGTEFPSGLHMRFQLLKGGSTKTAPRIRLSYPDSERKDRHAGARGEIPVLMLNTTALKDQLNVMLDREHEGGARIDFPKWLPDWFYQEMTAEIRTLNGWEKVSKRNEAWDLLVYDIALCLNRPIRIETLDWDAPPAWAEDWDFNDMVFNPVTDKSIIESAPATTTTLSDLGQLLS